MGVGGGGCGALASSAEFQTQEAREGRSDSVGSGRLFQDPVPLQRFASLSRFVETLVVADDKMAAFHGAGLKRYLLTVMAAAAKAFKHPSIRNPVNLVVTRLVILGSGEEGPQVGPSAAQTLRSFCAWQRGLNTPNDSDPDHFDTAILFTRQVRAHCLVLLQAQATPCPAPARGDGMPQNWTAQLLAPAYVGLVLSARVPTHLGCWPSLACCPDFSHASCDLPAGPVRGLHLRHSGHG